MREQNVTKNIMRTPEEKEKYIADKFKEFIGRYC